MILILILAILNMKKCGLQFFIFLNKINSEVNADEIVKRIKK